MVAPAARVPSGGGTRAQPTAGLRGLPPARSDAAASGDSGAADDAADAADGRSGEQEQGIARVLRRMAAAHVEDQEAELRLDRMRTGFDQAQATRAELMREANVLRDMALEQQKRDDEILKKWIALM